MSTDVLFEEILGNTGNIGQITLNRQQALNALNHEMITAIAHQLEEWEEKPSIKAVIVRAAPGRAFCAGGDVRSIYDKKLINDEGLMRFFVEEYQLNRKIFHFSKPYISFLNGITMGGGAGISIHGSHRVATERLVFAMPETAIGFFPDIGSSYFLSRLPYPFGLYLGLTGDRIEYQDCYALGLASQVVPENQLDALTESLAKNILSDKASVTKVIDAFAIVPPKSALFQHKKAIENCFDKNSVEEIIQTLKNNASEWCQKHAALLETKSPISLKVTFKELREAALLDFDACMEMEYRIMQHFLHSDDFFEGVRAMLVDKDRNPRWKPASLKEVSNDTVLAFFS